MQIPFVVIWTNYCSLAYCYCSLCLYLLKCRQSMHEVLHVAANAHCADLFSATARHSLAQVKFSYVKAIIIMLFQSHSFDFTVVTPSCSDLTVLLKSSQLDSLDCWKQLLS